MEVGRILPTEAAVILNVSPQFIRIAMQQGKLPIGTAVQALYDQAGNSIAVPIFESIFRKIILQEVA